MEEVKLELASTEFKMTIGLNKTKEGIYVLTKNKNVCFCPFQMPSVGRAPLSGEMVQQNQPCNSLCAKFDIDKDKIINNTQEVTGNLEIWLLCGNRQTYIIKKENITNIK